MPKKKTTKPRQRSKLRRLRFIGTADEFASFDPEGYPISKTTGKRIGPRAIDPATGEKLIVDGDEERTEG